MSKKEKPVVIVGGGITGLCLGVMLGRAGIPSVIIEKENRLGGLARSYKYGDFTFDIGPHRFHSDVDDVERFILEVLDKDYLSVPRDSLVRFKDHFYNWPIHPSYQLLKFPPKLALSIIWDLFSLYKKKPPETFKDQIINMYGQTMYHHFFEGYSSKFLTISPELTHPDWAKTGIDRAIIDNRLQIHTLWQLIRSALSSWSKTGFNFIYPKNGCETFILQMEQIYCELGGKVICGQQVDEMETNNDQIVSIRAGENSYEPSIVVWTGTVHSLMDKLHLPSPNLEYLALVCYNTMLTEGRRFSFQWSYHGATDIIFSRVSIPSNFDPANAPGDKRGMCVEVTCRTGDSIWNNPKKYLDRVVSDMIRERLIRIEQEVLDVQIERFPWAYPIYSLDYRENLKGVESSLSHMSNLIRGGRLGRFWYNNMDHCIEAGFRMAQDITTRLTRN